jgi:hypothetical protein
VAAELAALNNPDGEKSETSPFAEFSDLDPFFALTQNLNYRFAKVKSTYYYLLNFFLPTNACLSLNQVVRCFSERRLMFRLTYGLVDGGSTSSEGQNSSLLQPSKNIPHVW